MTRLALAWFVLLSACRSAGFHDGIFSKPGVRYAIDPPGDSWKPVSFDENDLAWVSDAYSIAVDSTCAQDEDAPLGILTNHLLMGFTERDRLSQEMEHLDGREALRSRYRAKLDGVAVELEMMVMKKDGCVYDFIYLSPPGHGEQMRATFERVLHGFKTEPIS